ncbi:MAG: hypothetical protein ACK4FK_05560 [Ferrovibrio sp.]|uniref:hypothetical protein n=1 Tax=Ferrovibrio sp. TaxID=1917215 RepID=UPI00391B62ED
MKNYDLVLIVGYFRSATAFLPVIRALSTRLRIAVLFVDADPSMRRKTGDAHEVFADLCRRFGADLINLGEPISATLLIVQQFPYDDDLAEAIQKNLLAKNRAGLMSLAMTGLEKHDAFLKQFQIEKVYIPSRRFMTFLLQKRAALSRYDGISIVEVGLPFSRHCIFPEFKVDWIIVAPTLFSFHSEEGKQHFLCTVNQLLQQIPPDDVVVYKSHNGNSLDYFAPRIHYLISGALERIPNSQSILKFVRKNSSPWLRSHVDRINTCILHRAILRRATPMSRITPYAGISLEAFLPGVMKGVIGGLSNSIWGTLYFDLPYYNCVDLTLRQGKSALINKFSDTLLDLNLEYFGVPFCNGRLDTDTRKQNIVQPDERAGDLVAAIMEDLAHAYADGNAT